MKSKTNEDKAMLYDQFVKEGIVSQEIKFFKEQQEV